MVTGITVLSEPLLMGNRKDFVEPGFIFSPAKENDFTCPSAAERFRNGTKRAIKKSDIFMRNE
ncbi:hypothetical protein GCM10028895_12600 [Pontibacter rugosus]